MRKKKIKDLLDRTNLKLIEVVEENKQLRERLKSFEQNESSQNEQRNKELEELEDAKANLIKTTSEYEAFKSEASSRIKELIDQNNSLTEQFNTLKGEHFDACKSIEDLKEKIVVLEAIPEDSSVDFLETPAPAPKVTPIVSLEERDKDAFDYASTIISNVVVDVAKLKNKLTASGSEMANELITLALGKTEMLKADILSIVMSDMVYDAKKQKIDLLYRESEEYFAGLLGQI